MDDVDAYLDGDEVARVHLFALGGGVHSFAFDLAPLDDGHPDAAVYDLGSGDWASADGASDMFTAVEHERVVELASEWLRRHTLRVTVTVSGFSAGQIAISEKGSWPFRARWRVSGGVIERLDTPVRIKTSSSRRLEVTPSGSPDAGNDSADLAVFCATIAASIGIKANVAALGDIIRSGTVVADGSIEPQLDAARGRVRHLLVPSNTRYLSGEREVQLVYDDHRLHGLHAGQPRPSTTHHCCCSTLLRVRNSSAPTRTVRVSVAGSRGWSCSSQQSRRSSCSSLRRTCSASSPVSHFSCWWCWRSALPRTASDRTT